MLALAAWLFLPLFGGAARPVRAVVVDLSLSVTRVRPRWAAWLERALAAEAEAASAAGEELVCVLYARGAVLAPSPARARAAARGLLAGGGGEGSELAFALELARRAAGRSPARLRILSDGSFTGADPAPVLARLLAEGARAEWLPPPPEELADLALVSLEAPESAAAGAPLAARALVRLSGPLATVAGAELALELEGPGPPRTWTIPLPDLQGGTPRPVPIDLGPAPEGLVVLRAVARLAGGRADPIPENDRASAVIRAGGPPALVLVAPEGALEGAAAWLEGIAGLRVLPADPGELALALTAGDVLLTVDMAPSALPGAVLRTFVEGGGGWLATAGPRTLATWGAERDPAGDLLPLEPRERGDEPRDVVLAVDGSGSMEGAPTDQVRRAALELVAAARARDRLELVLFTDRVEASIPLSHSGGPGARSEAARALLEARAPGGPTDVLGALDELAEERARARRPALLFLLSDGRDQPADPAALERAARLRARLEAAGARLVVVAVGERADLSFLARLAGPDRLHRPEGEAGLALLLRREVARERLLEGDPLEARLAPAQSLPEGSPAREVVLATQLQGGPLPPLERALRTRARPLALVLATAGVGEPLLALSRAGAGLAAVWTSSPVGGPGEDWAPLWRGSAPPLAPLLRALADPGRRGPRVRRVGDRLAVEGVPEGWPALLEAELAPLGDPRGTAERFVLAPPAEGGGSDPLRSRTGRLPVGALADPGGEAFELGIFAPGAGEALAALPFALAGTGELSPAPARVPRLERLPGAPPAPAAPARAPHPLAPFVLGAGLVLAALAALWWDGGPGPRSAGRQGPGAADR